MGARVPDGSMQRVSVRSSDRDMLGSRIDLGGKLGA